MIAEELVVIVFFCAIFPVSVAILMLRSCTWICCTLTKNWHCINKKYFFNLPHRILIVNLQVHLWYSCVVWMRWKVKMARQCTRAWRSASEPTDWYVNMALIWSSVTRSQWTGRFPTQGCPSKWHLCVLFHSAFWTKSPGLHATVAFLLYCNSFSSFA